jgi:hypothetical protein
LRLPIGVDTVQSGDPKLCRRWISSASGDYGAMVATLLTVAVAAAVGGIPVVNNTGAADDAELGPRLEIWFRRRRAGA